MFKKIIIIFYITLTFTGFTFANSSKYIINTSHSGAIISMDFSEFENSLLTGGKDGAIKVWNPINKQLNYQLQISHMPVRKLTASNKTPYVAGIVSDGINAVDIFVCNWKTGKIIFSNRLPEIPTFIDFSPKGNFIVYGKTDWNSLVFLDSDTGKILQPIKEGFGIVSSVFITETEKTLLTYNSSGSIQYWDLTNGKRKTKIPTVANLDKTSFSSNGRYMVGSNSNEILLIDLLTGNAIDSFPVKNAVISTIDSKSNNLVFCTSVRDEVNFTTLSFNKDGFKSKVQTKERNILLPNVILRHSGTVYFADNYANIFKTPPEYEGPVLLAENNILQIDDFCLTKSFITSTGAGKIFSISADFLREDTKNKLSKHKDVKIINVDKDSSFGLSQGRGSDIILWESSFKDAGSISSVNIETLNIKKITDISAPLLSAKYSTNKILTLDKSGDCRIIDYDNGENIFTYSSYGIKALDFIDENNIIAARNTSKTINSPLLHINTSTGETVPIEDNNLLIFDIKYDKLSRKLYTLGFEERNGSVRTVLKQHTGINFNKVNTLLSYYGEDIDSTFVPDFNSTKVFTAIGQGKMQMLYWGGFTSLEKTSNIPRKLNLNGDVIVSLNKNSSFNVFDQSTGEKIMNLYIFKDFSWLVLLKDGDYVTFNGAEKYLGLAE